MLSAYAIDDMLNRLSGRRTMATSVRDALRDLIEMCESLAALGYVHRESKAPISFSPDGALAVARAALAAAEKDQSELVAALKAAEQQLDYGQHDAAHKIIMIALAKHAMKEEG